jgi:hypothetical protein
VFGAWPLSLPLFLFLYDVNREEDLVVIVAVGQKTHNVLRIGGEEIEL